MNAEPRMLVIAYACDPTAGSEKGAGWSMLRALLDVGPCTVIVPDKHRRSLLDESERVWGDRLRVISIEESAVAQRWLQRPRVPLFLAYLLWIRQVRLALPSIWVDDDHDLCWHATYSTYWLPSPLRDLEAPTVLGPLGGAVGVPRRLAAKIPSDARRSDRIDRALTALLARLPSVAASHRAATTVLYQNPETQKAVARTRPTQPRDRILNHALGTTAPPLPTDALDASDDIVWVGKLEHRKGPLLALETIAADPDLHLTMIGDGPLRADLEATTHSLGIADRVHFTGAIARAQVQRHLATVRAALFTGIHEEGGLALAETMLQGTPCVVLGVGGARVIAEQASDPSLVRVVDPEAHDVVGALAEALREMPAAPTERTPLLDAEQFSHWLAEVATSTIAAHAPRHKVDR